MTSSEELQQFAAVARRSLEPGLQRDGAGEPLSAGACLHASLVVVMLLRRFGRGKALVRGGGPPDAGSLDSCGAWRGHYWVEVLTLEGEAFIVDVAADQFGFEPVIVLPLLQSLPRYQPGPQDEVDEAFDDLVREFRCQDLLAA
jgi:hypothetical protein